MSNKSSTNNVKRVEHTPGPWHTGGTGGLIVFDVSGYATANATTFHGRHEDGEDQANARLIAAAPDLLAVCEEFIRAAKRMARRGGSVVELAECYTAAEAAIAKARGQ